MSASYRLPDEPVPSPLSRVAVNPVWPLFAIMFGGGAILSWGWFVLNAFALGNSTRWKEVGYALGGFVGTFLVLLLLGVLSAALGEGSPALPYLVIAVTLWKLGVTYGLYHVQSQGFGIYEWYGGRVAAGQWGVFAAFLVGGTLPEAIGSSLLRAVLL